MILELGSGRRFQRALHLPLGFPKLTEILEHDCSRQSQTDERSAIGFIVYFGKTGSVVGECIRVIPAPVAGETHSVLDVRDYRFFAASACVVQCPRPKLQRGLVLAEALPGPRESREDLFARHVRHRRIAVYMFERGGEIIRRFAIRILLDGCPSSGVKVTNCLARQSWCMCARKVKRELV